MAGCFGSSAIDRHLEAELDRYLDECDEDAPTAADRRERDDEDAAYCASWEYV